MISAFTVYSSQKGDTPRIIANVGDIASPSNN